MGESEAIVSFTEKTPFERFFFFLTSVKDLETTATDIFTGFKRFLSGVIKTEIVLSIIWGLL